MEVSPLTLNRLSVYVRCLRQLKEDGVERVSSQQLATQFHLSAAQIRKDLAHFGEFGIRGVGYEVEPLLERLTEMLGLDGTHSLAVIGMGNLGSAIARHMGFNRGSFRVVAGLDNDADKIGRDIGHLTIESTDDISEIIPARGIEIAMLTVPGEVAQSLYDELVKAGIRSVLNFAPVRLKAHPDVRTRNVDLRIYLEELVYFLDPSAG